MRGDDGEAEDDEVVAHPPLLRGADNAGEDLLRLRVVTPGCQIGFMDSASSIDVGCVSHTGCHKSTVFVLVTANNLENGNPTAGSVPERSPPPAAAAVAAAAAADVPAV